MTPLTFRRIRARLGLTQTEMGQHLGGYAMRTVQDWEAKKRKIPHAVALILKAERKRRKPVNRSKSTINERTTP